MHKHFSTLFESVKKANPSKELLKGFSLSPTLFKIFLEVALKQWLQTCTNVGFCLTPTASIYNLHFVDDQLSIVQNDEEAVLSLQKL